MSATVADLNPKTLENAKRQFVELYGSALVMNTYLKIALLLVSLLALGLLVLNFRTQASYANVKPLVVRIDEVGRAEAVQYDASAYRPQAPELRYFLTQFVVKHFSRIRATVQREYPDSLFFLDHALADATIAQNDQSRAIETFLTNPSADEVDIVVQNVSLSELTKPPYKASVSFQKVFYTPGTGRARARDLRRADRFRAARPRAQRVRPRQSAGAADHLLPRRPGLRGGAAMIANTAFLAALTVFLLAAWLAGELTFLAPVQGGAVPRSTASFIVGRPLLVFLNLCALYYALARWLFLREPAAS